MLPTFPTFKKLERSDQTDIEKITKQYLPYSDFNFACLWSWDVKDNILVSELNDNLVAIVTDHFSDTPFYSYLGNNSVNKTLDQLFEFSAHAKNALPQLRLVPEASLSKIDLKKFMIEIDLDNSDYIYNLEELSTYSGSKYADKRAKVNLFLRSHALPSVRLLDLGDSKVVASLLQLNAAWTRNKAGRGEVVNVHREFVAFNRFVKANFTEAFCVGVFVEDQLVAYSIFTLLPEKYALCHFSKAAFPFEGAHDYLMQQSAVILRQRGCLYSNYQEDLGLPGLRFWKNSFKPMSFLRKYSVTRR